MSAGVYIHIPFCISRCSYCDFATDVYRDIETVERYVAALVSEICQFKPVGQNIDTIYFGGGTPSLLRPPQVERILTAVYDRFFVDRGSEVTMEMNPATVTPDSLNAYKRLGVNRASFGVQTFNDRALRLLARGHDANDARQTYQMLRDAGFENVSFDLIAGLPGQRLDEWKRNLDEAIGLSPEHLSLYLLEVHEGTPLAEQVRSGRQPKPDDDLAGEMYTAMCERLTAAGFEQYEISNFAKPGFESRHNTKYWRLDPVYGFGVSAHSFDGRERYANERHTNRYLELVESARSAEVLRQPTEEMSEFLFLGLRMNEGIDAADFEKRFKVRFAERYCLEITELKGLGLMSDSGGAIRLTDRGRLYSNEVFARFI